MRPTSMAKDDLEIADLSHESQITVTQHQPLFNQLIFGLKAGVKRHASAARGVGSAVLACLGIVAHAQLRRVLRHNWELELRG